MHAPRGATLESNINVTPLVDVCLVLLIIFMVVTPVIVNGSVPVQLPKTATAERLTEATRQLSITVKDDGAVYIGAVAVRAEQVAGELQRMHEKSPDLPVAVRGDKRVPYGDVMRVLGACRAAGFTNVGLTGDQSAEPRTR